jgi:peptide-methionine (S)-S-oxide reductase
MSTHTQFLRKTAAWPLASLLVLCSALAAGPACSAEAAHVIPAYTGQEQAPAGQETAVVAGGCFWGVQGVYEHVKGVLRAESGYAGGNQATAHYEVVSSGETGHAESVKITFDPHKISYAKILQIFFSVVHDPTQLNRQGPDVGTNYRSAIFPQDAQQAQVAKDYIAQLNHARVFNAAIVTRIEPGMAFYAAEQYHQDFLVRNPSYPYIVYNDLPKVENLKRVFPADYQPNPVLVLSARPHD